MRLLSYPKLGMLVAVSLLFASPVFGAASHESLLARVVSVIGNVTVDKKPLHPGDGVHFGQAIELGPDAGLKLLTVVDRSIFDLTSGAAAVFEKGESVEVAGVLKLARGRVRFSIGTRMTWVLDAQGIHYTLLHTTGAVLAAEQPKAALVSQSDRNGTVSEPPTMVRSKTTDSLTAATGKDGIATQLAGTRQGNVVVTEGEDKLTTLNEIDAIALSGKLAGGTLRTDGKVRRPRQSSGEIRDWVARSAIDDPVFLQSIALGEGESPRARGVTYQFLAPPADVPRDHRPPVAFDDPDHRFSARTPLFELNGSAQQVSQQANLTH